MLEILSYGDRGWGDELLFGAWVTLRVSVAAFIIGLALAILAAAMKLSHSRVLRAMADVYTTVVRGVPELLVIYLLYFGTAGVVGGVVRQLGFTNWFSSVGSVEFVIGSFAVGLVSGAYSTEVLRGAVLAVPKGQIEAARACGMTRFLIFRRITAPLALRYALPGLGNVWQLTLKDTALISVIGLKELMSWASTAARVSHDALTVFPAAAVLYLVITTVSNELFRRVEIHANRGVRRA